MNFLSTFQQLGLELDMVAKVEFLVTGLLSLHSGLYVRKVRNLANSYPVCLVVIVSLDLDNTSHATQLVKV